MRKLNIGVPTWIDISSNEHPNDGSYWSRGIGYAKVGNKWGVALRTISGNYQWADEADVDCWLFNEAPRAIRIEAVGRIPELLAALVESAQKTTLAIRQKTAEANQIAEAIAQATKQPNADKNASGRGQ